MQLDGVAPVFCLPVFNFKRLLASEARQAVGRPLWVSTGGRCGHVVKPGVLRACPHVHADPLLIHQVAPVRHLHRQD